MTNHFTTKMMLHINYYLNIPENSLIYDMIKERFLDPIGSLVFSVLVVSS